MEPTVSRYRLGPIFTPPVVSKWEGPLATLMLPHAVCGRRHQRRRPPRRADRIQTAEEVVAGARIGICGVTNRFSGAVVQ